MAFRPVIPGAPRYTAGQTMNFRPLERGIDSGIARNKLMEQREIEEQVRAQQEELQRDQMAAQSSHRNAMLGLQRDRMKMAQANADRSYGLQASQFGLQQQKFQHAQDRRKQILNMLTGGGGGSSAQPAPTLTGDPRQGPVADPQVPQAPAQGGILAGLSPQGRSAAMADYMMNGGKNIGAIIQNDSAKSLTPAQKAIDSKFAEDYAKFSLDGGAFDVSKQLQQLDFSIKELEKGGVSGLAEGIAAGSPAFGSQVYPRAVEVKNAIDEVTQRNLRQVLGGQFAQQEGEQLIQRAYQPYASEKDNLRRVRRLRTSIANAYKQKLRAIKYFEKNQTLAGFKGQLPTHESIARDAGLSGSNNVDKQKKRYKYNPATGELE